MAAAVCGLGTGYAGNLSADLSRRVVDLSFLSGDLVITHVMRSIFDKRSEHQNFTERYEFIWTCNELAVKWLFYVLPCSDKVPSLLYPSVKIVIMRCQS